MPVQWDDAVAPKGVQWDEPISPPAPTSSVGGILWNQLKAAPAGMASKAAGDVQTLYNALSNPRPSVTLPLVAGGPASSVVSRLGGFAMGKMLEQPSSDPVTNLLTAAKGVVGNPSQPLSMLMSPAAAEAIVPAVGKLIRSAPAVKGAINEGQAQELAGSMEAINPATRAPVQAAPVSSYLRGGTTAAQIKRATESGSLQDAVSQRFDQALGDIATRAGNPTINTPALQQAYSMMPKLAQEQLVGTVAPGGFTLEQAHAVRSWLGGPAFSQSPLGQGVGHIPQQRLWGQVSNDIQTAVAQGGGPQVVADWQRANSEYGGMQALQEALGGAFQGQPNRIMLNRSALSDYLAKNEQDITRRLGNPQAYQDFVNRVLSGGQPGTRDYLTPGGGTPSEAAMQTFGRGTGGAPQYIGVPLRTILPNVGSSYTGLAPYSLPPALQSILDIALQRRSGQME